MMFCPSPVYDKLSEVNKCQNKYTTAATLSQINKKCKSYQERNRLSTLVVNYFKVLNSFNFSNLVVIYRLKTFPQTFLNASTLTLYIFDCERT